MDYVVGPGCVNLFGHLKPQWGIRAMPGDSEMGKAKMERDRRLREAKKLNTKIKAGKTVS